MDKLKVTGSLRTYLQWPFAVTVIWAVMVVLLFLYGGLIPGLIGLGFLILYFVIALIFYLRRSARIFGELISFATQYASVQKDLLEEFVLPYALVDAQGHFLWMNREFSSLTGLEKNSRRKLLGVFPDMKREDLPGIDGRTECLIKREGRTYRAAMQKIRITELMDEDSFVEADEGDYLIAVYLFDETELEQLLEERDRNKLVCGLLCLDNAEEAMESVEEVRRSLLLALIERKINRYFSEVDGIVRKMENDKYFFVLRRSGLEELENKKFSLLEDVKTVNIGNEMAMTISMGIGLGSRQYADNAEAARIAMELALGRGGDQVVVKDGYRTRYFGGKTESVEKVTRVKARVKAQALREIMMSRDKVIVMGHKITDADALGAAVGIYCAAKRINKPAYIVVDDAPEGIRPLLNKFMESPEYPEDMFVDRRQAKELADAGTVVIVVDTNNAGRVECEELLHRSNTIVVLDHHRQGKDIISNAVLSYIEPYASSACEMVAEIVQYFDEQMRLRFLEADALYAGIMIDTNNFMTRTGVRTFEAAAYLRRCGADITRIRKLFRDNIEDCRAKAQAVAQMEFFENTYAISECPSQGLKAPTVVAAQAANELLNVVGVKASFVLTEFNHTIYISARAIDEVNVQLIMERLGGGGHLNVAGAQLPDHTVSEGIALLKATIREMKEEGDLN